MHYTGYAYLHETLKLRCFWPKQPAVIKAVTRIGVMGDYLAVPNTVAPAGNDLLGHILFALKHEGVNLAILAQTLPHIQPGQLLQELGRAPNGVYIRKACFLWEHFIGQSLDCKTAIKGAATPLFDPARYVTGPSRRNARWRIDFNGLGTIDYCPTVELTSTMRALLDANTLEQVREFIASLPAEMMDRAISWAYLHETKDSFAIEKESPSAGKAERFMQLLRQAHEKQDLSEEYLVELQNGTITNPFDKASSFRHEQNHLHNGLRGAAGVSYIPPPPDLCRELMDELMSFANGAALKVDPLVAAGVISFGFVFIHPFMDGNGRLSRFLIHQTLCRSGALEHGLLLPVSVAMKHEEQAYLEALKDFSKPARNYWNATWLDGEQLDLEFTGHASIYRYWDATRAVEFTLSMAQRALEIELREETEYLEHYDCLIKAVNERFDVRSSDLSKLVMMCLDNNGIVSLHRRKQFRYSVPAEVFDFIEAEARKYLA